MKGGLVSPTLFNVVVGNVIRKLLAIILEDQRVNHYGLGAAVGGCWGFSTPMIEFFDPETQIGCSTL